MKNVQILNECLRQLFSTVNENEAIDTLLRYIGRTFSCERAYIFEIMDDQKVNNTYEWCAENITPQKDLLQNVPFDGVGFWFDIFDREGLFSLANIEDIQESHPLTYAYLRPQGIESLVAGPLQGNGAYVGFIGVDNPDKDTLDTLSSLLSVIGYFISILLERRALTDKLQKMSYQDTLTHTLNRNALLAFFADCVDVEALGIVYCDISGLKQVNDKYGHAAGDKLILQSCDLIADVMDTGKIYRIGGDEFVVVCPNITQEAFAAQIEKLKQRVSDAQYHIAVGTAWTETLPVILDDMLKEADKEMYQDKELYYTNNARAERRKSGSQQGQEKVGARVASGEYKHLIPAFMEDSRESYICIGDYQSRYYYISDGMKNMFGFPSNVVYDFMAQWEKRIIGKGQKKIFRKNFEQMLQEKNTTYDFSHTMRGKNDDILLVRCSGLIQWDDTYTKPVTFLGSAQIQKSHFPADPITGFYKVQGAVEKLENLEHTVTVLLFKLNHFGKINESRGRETGNQLLRNIAAELREVFQESVNFYRLDGLKFVGIPYAGDRLRQEFIDTVRAVVSRQYKIFDISVAEPVTFISVGYSNEREQPWEFIQNVSELISVADFNEVPHIIENSSAYLKKLRQEISMEFTLVQDIQNDMANFRIVVQPVVSFKTGRILGGEVLLRWKFRGIDISPSVFIPIIERENLMRVVGRWVLEQTVQCCRSLSIYRPDMYLTFNVSYQQILVDDFAESIKAMLTKYGVAGSRIVAELTETHEDENPEKLQVFIDSCEKMGVRIALDDFGSGYSSLGLLLKYSAQIIKLDRAILKEMTQSKEKRRFVHSLVESCHKLNKMVCIEGVETEEELSAVTNAGCDVIQGFYYYKPMELYDMFHAVARDTPEAK